jgi:hypothetical protein
MDLVYCLAQRCKLLFSATITLPDLTRINLYTELWVRGCRAVSKLVKTALNTATLNICEKLKMTQRDTGNIKSKVNDSMRLVVVVKHVTF